MFFVRVLNNFLSACRIDSCLSPHVHHNFITSTHHLGNLRDTLSKGKEIRHQHDHVEKERCDLTNLDLSLPVLSRLEVNQGNQCAKHEEINEKC